MKRILLAAIFLALTATAAHSNWRDVYQASRAQIDVQEYRLAAVVAPAPKPAPKYEARMYGMTGLFGQVSGASAGVFTVLDDIANKFPTVKIYKRAHYQKHAVLATAIANYEIDKLPIILLGHSLGANATTWIATRLLARGIPVASVFAYDPTPFVLCVPRNVQTAIGWQRTYWWNLGGGNLEPCLDYVGAIEKHSSDDAAVSNIWVRGGHTWVDDAPQVHRLTIKHVGEVVHMLREMRGAK